MGQFRALLSILLFLMPHAPAFAVCPVDNFDDGDDAGWMHCGQWSPRQEPVWDASSGSYCLGLSQPLKAPPPPPLSIASEWLRAGEDPLYHNGCVTAGFRTGSVAAGTWSTHFVLGLRADCKNGGYKAMIGPSLGRISLYRRLELMADSLAESFLEDTHYRAQFCAAGSALSLTVWPRDEPRPATPQLSATNDRFKAGNIGIGVFIENDNRGPTIQGCFDDISFAPAEACAGDLDCDGQVGLSDVSRLTNRWGSIDHCDGTEHADMNGDCTVGFGDALSLIRAWGACVATPQVLPGLGASAYTSSDNHTE